MVKTKKKKISGKENGRLTKINESDLFELFWATAVG